MKNQKVFSIYKKILCGMIIIILVNLLLYNLIYFVSFIVDIPQNGFLLIGNSILSFFLTIIIVFLFARRLTNKIADYVNSIDLENPEIIDCDELLPLLKKIKDKNIVNELLLAEINSHSKTLLTIINNMREGLLLIDNATTVILANQAAINLFGIEINAIGLSLIELSRNNDLIQSVEKALQGNVCETIIRQNGKIYCVYCNPIPEGVIILFVDITAKSDSERQRKEFSANVSHELKTPLTVINGLSELIATKTAKPEDIAGFGEKIHAQSQRMISIINDIIKLSKFDEENNNRNDVSLKSNFEEFDLIKLAESVIEVLHEKANKNNIAIKLISSSTLIVYANRIMIDELLYNLIDNAIKYNYDNGKVIVDLSIDNEKYNIAVCDTGIGIPIDEQCRVFERFYRVDKSRNKHINGTGLGLSIVKHIVEYHNGKVSLESEIGKGTKILCSFICP